MLSVLQESAPSYTMVKKWARLFHQERERCEDDPRPGRPLTVVTEENARNVDKLILADRRIRLWQIAEKLHISKVVQKRRGKLARGVLFIRLSTRREFRDRPWSKRFSRSRPGSQWLFPLFQFEKGVRAKKRNLFFSGLKALYARCEKSILFEGDYIEK